LSLSLLAKCIEFSTPLNVNEIPISFCVGMYLALK